MSFSTTLSKVAPESTALLDGPSAKLYAEVTGMLARFSTAVEVQEIELPSTRAETEQALRLALIAMTEAQKRIQRQEDRINELENLSQTDELTGLANRRGFDEDFRKGLAHAKRAQHGGILLMIDLDRFKSVNDTYGHAAGYALLQAVAAVLKADVRETDTVARIGGDEFAVLMPDLDATDGKARADRLAERLNGHMVDYLGTAIQIQASVGMFAYDGTAPATNVLAEADRNMYREKSARRLIQAA